MLPAAELPGIRDFVEKQYVYTKSQVAKNNEDIYWNTVGLWTTFLEGIVLGYNDHVPVEDQLDHSAFLLLQVPLPTKYPRSSEIFLTSSLL
jgi:hypothetical protein